VGKRADFAIWDMTSGIATAGSWDPVASLVLTGPHSVRDLYVEGRAVVKSGHLTGVELGKLVEHQNTLARKFFL
jgi:cytosine/adenosine deaminase-related metal-dependent hydrolase